MHQPARIYRVLLFSAAAAAMTFIYQLPTMSPLQIGYIHYALAAETHSVPATISNCFLQPQQLAVSSYFMPLLPQQLSEALIYIMTTATISRCYVLYHQKQLLAVSIAPYHKAAVSSLYFTAIAAISSAHSNY